MRLNRPFHRWKSFFAAQRKWAGTLALLALGGWVGTGVAATIPATAPEITNGLSAYNWVVKDGSISSATGGSSFLLAFSGTRRVALQVDTRALANVEATRYPVFSWAVNGGPQQTHQLARAETTVVLADGVPDPTIDFYLRGFSPFEDRYDGDHPLNSVRITGFQVDAGGRATASLRPLKTWLNIGDSILSGDAALERGGQGRPAAGAWAAGDDARASYGYLLARHYGYAESRLAYGGYDYQGGLAKLPDLTTLVDQITSSVSRLRGTRLQPPPDVVLVNLGENGAPPVPAVVSGLTKLRLRAGSAARIIVMVPLSGKARREITAAVTAYRDASHDAALELIDLGSVQYETADGQHPTAAGHQTIYAAVLPLIAGFVH